MKTEPKIAEVAAPEGQAEWLSALVDGEVRESEFDALFDAAGAGADWHSRWHCYQLMGDAMRQSEPPMAQRSPATFLDGVMARLPSTRPVSESLASGATTLHLRAPAANDATLRWKAMAGVASVAAVVALSWGVLNSAPGSVPGLPDGGAKLAQAAPDATALSLVAQPVAIKTEQGTLIRDARLEQLMAEHRQFGGASALQMPAGFLRSATFETAPQR